jgi:AcrR family transcriptional regulator
VSEQSNEPGTRDPRWQRRPTERRREIVDAAVDVFGRHGFDAATIADIARKAGVSTGTVVHYFGSKGGLFEAAMHERFLEQVESLEAVMASHRGSSRELLRAVLTQAWKHLMRPSTTDLMVCGMAQARRFPDASSMMFRETGERWRRLMGAVLTAGIANGEFRPLNVDLQARVIGAGLKGVALGICQFAKFEANAPEPDELLEQYLETIDLALAAPAVAPPYQPAGNAV